MTYTTTAAAQLAGVTVDTIRVWCRIGAVRATKAVGRWVIEAASLAHRIRLGIHPTMKESTIDTPWPADHPDAALLGEARAAGVADQALFDAIGERAVTSGTRPFSRADERKANYFIDAARRRTTALDAFQHLAACLGHDGAAKREIAVKLSDPELDKLIRDTRAYAKRQDIDVRTPEKKTADHARLTGKGPATEPQVPYLADLMKERHQAGREDGFAQVSTYYTKDGVDIAKLRTLTNAAASAMISSLTQEA